MYRRCLGDLLDPAGVNALGAYQNPPDLTADAGPHGLQIRLPDSLGLIVGVANVMPDGSSLPTNCADSCHNYFLHILSMIRVVE